MQREKAVSKRAWNSEMKNQKDVAELADGIMDADQKKNEERLNACAMQQTRQVAWCLSTSNKPILTKP